MTSVRVRLTALCVATATVLGAGLVACAPDPTPTPTPAFASEAEAYAAAEEVYRAYIDAVNEVDFTDPSTFEPVFALLSGSASSTTREGFSEFRADGITVIGTTAFDRVTENSVNPSTGSASISLCSDVSHTDVVDAEGNSLVPPDRPDTQAIVVTFVTRDSVMTIDSMNADEELACG